VTPSTTLATIAVGDIHGNLAALADLLQRLRDEVHAGDVVVFLGDYIDRGPDPRGCIDAILAYRSASPATIVCLRGNHEDWLLRTFHDHGRHSWLLGMQGLGTVRSYSAEAERALREAAGAAGLQLFLRRCQLPYDRFFEAMPESHLAFFTSLALYYEGPDAVCTHAGLDPHVDTVSEQSPRCFVWGHQAFPSGYRGSRPIVYGHYDNADVDQHGWPGPRFTGNTIGIDTIAHGVLTAIRLPDRRVFQSARHIACSPTR
jgi:serine/threonine protein phosphatase 1